MNWKGLTSTFWAVDKITSFSDKDIDCITNTPLSNLRNLESNEINLHNAKKVQDFLSRTLTIHGTAQGKGGDHLYSTLPFPPAHEHSNISNSWTFPTLHVRWLPCIFNYTAGNYQTGTGCDLPPSWIAIWLMMECWFLFTWFNSRFCNSNLIKKSGRFELASTITLVLQANQLTKSASHPKIFLLLLSGLE